MSNADLDATYKFPDSHLVLAATRANRLSPREREIFLQLGRALSNHQIATLLSISDLTVRCHLTRIFTKLEVSSRLEAGLVSFIVQLHLSW
ncbi:helix-turn-helix domain-containing protein [Actinocrinis sp.]|uniref:helix-turn-helix domain-containing protein n=1 Tax=Actinocrinis sp. TaxID=1920516 RepID=UPI0039C8AFBD